MAVATMPGWATIPLASDLMGDGSLEQVPVPRDWALCLATLDELRHLEDNWDDNGSHAPDPAIIDFAVECAQWWQLQGCTGPSTTAPSPDGTVVLGWQSKKGLVMSDIEFLDTNSIEFFQLVDSKVVKHYVWHSEESL